MSTSDARSVEALVAAIEGGASAEYLFFWGHRGAIERACFSQWYPASFVIDDITYETAEHWMMASKARLFGDDEAVGRILEADSPGAAKALGRRVRDFDEARWNAERFELVVRGNVAKFGQHPELGRILQASGNRVLVEASPTDRIWGIGLAKSNEHASDPRTWRGLNLLGFALMEARGRLRG